MASHIYLDHAATTPVRAEVLDAMTPFFGPRFGNPSSVHRWGRDARTALDEARARIAACLRAQPDEIVFTSGGTEGDNLAILGTWRMRRAEGRNAVVTTPTEHKAVLEVVHQVAREGGEERLLRVDAHGEIAAASLDGVLDDAVAVCSVMWINNETGVVQDVPVIGARARAVGALMHTDAVQAFGKLPIDTTTLPVDLLSLSGHKIGAPKGIGAMYIRRGTPFAPLFHGGSQDRGRRPGTENVAFAVALAVAAELQLAEREHECRRLGAMRDALQAAILARVPDAVVHGAGAAQRAPHILSVSVPGTDSESLLMALDLAGIAASGGSACQSGSVSPSHVLCAMGVPRGLAGAAVRLSVGMLTTDADIVRVSEVFPALVEKARRLAGAA
jgi:cysteine desulfurase